MGHLPVQTTSLRARLARIADWLYGCKHRKTSFPVTVPAVVAGNGRPAVAAETYVVCLGCGRRFGYDWGTMRLDKQRTVPVEGRPISGRTSE